jgi:hypothetical protein
MTDAFDPYFKWLGIPKVDQPPHAYRLLGIELFESDTDVISNAADGRMAQIKSFQAGKFGAVSQKLLNEVAAAKVCLLKPEKKAEYDRRLRAHLQQKTAAAKAVPAGAEVAEASAAAEVDAASLSFLNESPAPTRTITRPAERPKQAVWLVPAVVVAGVIAVVGGVAAYSFMGGDEKGKSGGSHVASLAGSSRDPQPGPSVQSSEKPPVGMSDGGSKPAAADPIAAKESGQVAVPHFSETPVSPLRPVEAEPNPKTETAEPENTASEGTSKKGTEDNAEKVGESTSAEPTSHEAEPAKKLPVPDKDQYLAMKAKIIKIYQKEFAEAKTPEAKRALAMKLDAQGDTSKEDPVEHYSLWRFALEGACEAGDFPRGASIADKIEGQFEVNGDALKVEVFSVAAARTTITPEAVRSLCEIALKLAVAAAARDDFDFAARYGKLASTTVRRVKDPQFSKDVLAREREVEHLKTRYTVVTKAMETLKSNADDAKANLAVGQWLCFVKGDWERGLPYMAKGSREELAALAKQELAKPAEPKEQVVLADGWWALAEKDRTETKANCKGRAISWYEQALPVLSGLEKTRVEKQIARARTGPVIESRPRGGMQRGNVALASNGTTATGPDEHMELLLNGNPNQKERVEPRLPCVITITFAKVYMLRQIRFHISETPDVINAYYRVLVSRDGTNYELLQDHSKELGMGWQEMLFPARPVKAVKLEGTNSKNCNWFILTQFEAYCYPVASAPTKPVSR